MPDMPERCPMCGAERVRTGLPHGTYECGTRVTQHAGSLVGFECLERQVDAARAEAERLKTENERLHRRIEGLEAKIARQRAVISRLQAAVERRNSQERIEALWRKLSDEKRLLDRIEALEAMLLHLYRDTVVPGTGYCNRCGMIGGHDESCAMAEVEVLLGLTGGATHV